MKELVIPAVFVAVTSSALLIAPPVHACSAPPPSCDPSRITLPARGIELPANAPGVFARVESRAELLKFELAAVDSGLPLMSTETRNAWTILKFGEPLVSGGSYRIIAQAHCGSPFPDSDYQEEIVFRAGPARDLPTTLGTVIVGYRTAPVFARSLVDGGSPTDVTAIVAELGIEPSPELAPFLPITSFRTLVDGALWGDVAYGHGASSSEPSPDVVTKRDFVRVHASCGRELASNLCEPVGVPRGLHVVDIFAHVAGMPNELHLTTDIDLLCPPDGGTIDASPIPPRDAGADVSVDPDVRDARSLDVALEDAPPNPDRDSAGPDAASDGATTDIAPDGIAVDGRGSGEDAPNTGSDIAIDAVRDAPTDSSTDAAARPDATDAGSPNPTDPTGPSPSTDSDGCAISSGRSADRSWGLFGLTGAALLTVTRRLRRSRPHE